MSEGAQTINGVKTFGNQPVFSSGITVSSGQNINANSIRGIGSSTLELSSSATMRNVRIVGGTDCQFEI